MNGDRDQIDRLIQAVLAVDPSPEFEALIRSRIRIEAGARRKTLQTIVPGWGLVAALAIVLVLTHQLWRGSDREEMPAESRSLQVQTDEPLNLNNEKPSQPSFPRGSPRTTQAIAETVILTDGDPLAQATASAISTESLKPPRLEEFSLEVSEVPLISKTLASDNNLPQFQIQPFSLLASNEGVAE
jgi:hypothetical protein